MLKTLIYRNKFYAINPAKVTEITEQESHLGEGKFDYTIMFDNEMSMPILLPCLTRNDARKISDFMNNPDKIHMDFESKE